MDSRPNKEREKDGVKTRTEVLGKAWVEKSQANVDDFNREFNEYLDSHCWNDIWNRPSLPRKTRSPAGPSSSAMTIFAPSSASRCA